LTPKTNLPKVKSGDSSKESPEIIFTCTEFYYLFTSRTREAIKEKNSFAADKIKMRSSSFTVGLPFICIDITDTSELSSGFTRQSMSISELTMGLLSVLYTRAAPQHILLKKSFFINNHPPAASVRHK
jgi:hypothetical protein